MTAKREYDEFAAVSSIQSELVVLFGSLRSSSNVMAANAPDLVMVGSKRRSEPVLCRPPELRIVQFKLDIQYAEST